MDEQREEVTIHISNGQFYLWNVDDIRLLRTKYRIIGSPFGSVVGAHFQLKQSTLPLVLCWYEVKLLYDEKLCKFVKLKLIDKNLKESKNSKNELFQKFIEKYYNQVNAKDKAERCEKQLKYTGKLVDPPDLPLSRLKLTILDCPNTEYSNFKFIETKSCDILENADSHSYDVYQIFRDLWRKNLYVSSGMKFGSDFLAYIGDPFIYHSSYSVKVAMEIEKKFDSGIREHDIYCNLNTFQRICHGTHKIPLLAFVDYSRVPSPRITYKTVNQKDVLEIGRREECVLKTFLIPTREISKPEKKCHRE